MAKRIMFLLLAVGLMVMPAFATYPDVTVNNNYPDSVTFDGSQSVSVEASGPGVTVTSVDIKRPDSSLVSALSNMLGTHLGDVYSVVGCSIFVPSMPWVFASVMLIICVWSLFRLGGAIFGRR